MFEVVCVETISENSGDDFSFQQLDLHMWKGKNKFLDPGNSFTIGLC
jgi:hypothetical protein